MKYLRSTSVVCLLLLAATAAAEGISPFTLESFRKVAASATSNEYGSAVAGLGDVDGDGVGDYAVGAPFLREDSVGGGGVWVQFMRADGTLKTVQEISRVVGGLSGALDPFDTFGAALASLGDLDGDGVEDLAVGAPRDDDGASSAGAVWILFLKTDGTVKDEQKISRAAGGFAGTLLAGDYFGASIARLGDLDGDGVTELAVGAPRTGPDAGAVWILYLLADGTVKDEYRIDQASIGIPGVIAAGDRFGEGLAELGDLDGDGIVDVAVGASGDPRSGVGSGAVHVLFLNVDGTPKATTPITFGFGGLTGDGFPLGAFGRSLANLGDMNADGVVDLAVGDPLNVEGATGSSTKGAVWILLLETDGTVKAHQKIGQVAIGLNLALPDDSEFGAALAGIGDHDGDGSRDILVGARLDTAGGPRAGAIYTLFLQIAATVQVRNAGTNPLSLSSDDPVLGGTWTPTVDLTTTGHSFAQILAYRSPLQILLAGGQTLLMNIADPSGEQLAQPLVPGSLAAFPIAIPADPSLSGLCLTVQGIHALGVVPFQLSNAIDVVVGQ